MLSVHDRAKGIKPDELPKLFQPFYTTKKNTTRGLGIGLSLIKQAIEQEFSGSILVSSSTNHGTIFTATLRLPPTNINSKAKTSHMHKSTVRQPVLQPTS